MKRVHTLVDGIKIADFYSSSHSIRVKNHLDSVKGRYTTIDHEEIHRLNTDMKFLHGMLCSYQHQWNGFSKDDLRDAITALSTTDTLWAKLLKNLCEMQLDER